VKELKSTRFKKKPDDAFENRRFEEVELFGETVYVEIKDFGKYIIQART